MVVSVAKPVCVVLLALLSGTAAAWFETGQDASLMLSGVDFNNTGGPFFYNHPSGIATDGTRLLVCDRFNNRVLVWNQPPLFWNAPPDIVLGQPDFISNNPGTGKHQLNWAGNASVGENGRLAIADTDNDRILLWDSFPTASGQPADVAIDLPSIPPRGSMPYAWPWGVWTDGSRLAAVATQGSALLFWNSFPVVDNQLPDYTIVLTEFGTPRNISTDGETYFFVGDHNARVNNRPGTFFWNSYPDTLDQPYDFYRDEWVKGVKTATGGLVAGGINSIYVWNAMPTGSGQDPDIVLTPSMYKNGDGPDVLVIKGRLYVTNYNGNDLLVFDSMPAGPATLPDWALGASSIYANTLDSIGYVQNPVLASDGTRLIATSDFDRTICIWNTIPTSSGIHPDQRISLQPNNLQVWDNALYANRFAMAARRQVSVWLDAGRLDQPPSRIFNDSIGSAMFSDLQGVALDSSFLYLADKNGRLYIWVGIPASLSADPLYTIDSPGVEYGHLHSDGEYLIAVKSNPAPEVHVYRVEDIRRGELVPFKTVTSGPGLQLNLPRSAITFDGALAIANTCGSAVFLWGDVNQAGDTASVITLGQEDRTGYRPAIGIDRLFWPASLLAIGGRLWVGECKFSSRIPCFSSSAGVDCRFGSAASLGVRVAPNPAFTFVELQGHLPRSFQVDIFDAAGRRVVSARDRAGFNLSCLSGGVYTLRLTAEGRLLLLSRLVKQ